MVSALHLVLTGRRVLLTVIAFKIAVGTDVYVSHAGRDGVGCGSNGSPCGTVRYAVSSVALSGSLNIFVDSAGGPYTDEGDVNYVIVTRKIMLTGTGDQSAVIQCTQSNRTKLFIVNGTSTNKVQSNRISTVSLSLKNIAIFGCHGDGGMRDSPIQIIDAALTATNCIFRDNGPLLSTPRRQGCRFVSVNIRNSEFSDNFASRPYFLPGISLIGCDETRLNVEDCVLFATPVLVHSGNSTDVSMVRAVVNGTALRGSSIRLVFPGVGGQSRLTMVDSTVGDHVLSRASALAISLIGRQSSDVSITINRCQFVRNVRQKTRGGAISIVAKSLSSVQPEPVAAFVRLADCEFTENSASDFGGALYVAFVSAVRLNRCVFKTNSGLEGGAIFLLSATDVSITGSTFVDNRAASATVESFASRGGAISATKSDLQFLQCNFTGNTARFAGSAMYLENSIGVNVTYSVFVEPLGQSSSDVGPDNSLVVITAVDPMANAPNVQLVLNTFKSSTYRDHNVLLIRGQTAIRNVTVQCSTLNGSLMRSRQLSEKAPYQAGYQLQRLAVWCEAVCPDGFYSTKSNDNGKLLEFNSEECTETAGGESDSGDDPCSARSKRRFEGGSLCRPCPVHTHCAGGRPIANTNYYGFRTWNGEFESRLCPLNYCRPDVNGSEPSCTANRTGLLCTGCAAGRIQSVNSMSLSLCKINQECPSNSSFASFAVCFLAIYFVLLLMAHKLITRVSDREDSGASYKPLLSPSDGTNMGNRYGSLVVEPQDESPPDEQRMEQPARNRTEPEQRVSSSAVPHTQTDKTSDGMPTTGPAQICLSASLSYNSIVACFLSMAFFYQLLPVVYPRITSSSSPIDLVISCVIEIFRLHPPFSAFGGVCVLSVSASRYFLSASFYWFQSALIIVLFTLIAIFFRFASGPFRGQNIKMLTTHFGSAMLFVMMLNYVPMVRSSLDSMTCTTLNGTLVAYADASTTCYQSWQKFTIFYFVACIAPLCLVVDTAAFQLSRGRIRVVTYVIYCLFPVAGLLGVPITNASCWIRERRRRSTGNGCSVVDTSVPPDLMSVSTHAVVVVQSIVIRPYRKYFSSPVADCGWLTIVLTRNFAICLCGSLLVGQPAARGVVLAVACVLFAIDSIIFEGLASKMANKLETILLSILTVLGVMNLMSSVTYESSDSSDNHLIVLDDIGRVLMLLPVVVGLLTLVSLLLVRCFCFRRRRV